MCSSLVSVRAASLWSQLGISAVCRAMTPVPTELPKPQEPELAGVQRPATGTAGGTAPTLGLRAPLRLLRTALERLVKKKI